MVLEFGDSDIFPDTWSGLVVVRRVGGLWWLARKQFGPGPGSVEECLCRAYNGEGAVDDYTDCTRGTKVLETEGAFAGGVFV